MRLNLAVLYVYFLCFKTYSVYTKCGQGLELKFMINLTNAKFLGESHVVDGASKIECSAACITLECQSFGINVTSKKCYLYDYHVWSGDKVDKGVTLDYYWLHYSSCPDSYTFNSVHNFCYKFVAVKSRWSHAMASCIEDGGLLAKVETDAKFDLVVAVGQFPLFMGATDINANGQWSWFDGSEMAINWKGIREEYGGTNCLVIVNNTAFSYRFCYGKFKYVCEIPLI